jgi:hypothetical protein
VGLTVETMLPSINSTRTMETMKLGIKMKLLVLSQGKLEFMHLNSESRDWQNSMKKERIGNYFLLE